MLLMEMDWSIIPIALVGWFLLWAIGKWNRR